MSKSRLYAIRVCGRTNTANPYPGWAGVVEASSREAAERLATLRWGRRVYSGQFFSVLAYSRLGRAAREALAEAEEAERIQEAYWAACEAEAAADAE